MSGNSDYRVGPRGGKLEPEGRSLPAVPAPDHGTRAPASAPQAPNQTPILPSGWAPLTSDQLQAVLAACNTAPDCIVFRVGPPANPAEEYRVYKLTDPRWAGLCVATLCELRSSNGAAATSGDNREILGFGADAMDAVELILRFFNRDLRLRAAGWRLSVSASTAGEDDDPRRV